jgi:hypothetical protein
MSEKGSSRDPGPASEEASYEAHMGFAEWHMMLAEVERMPVQTLRELVTGQVKRRSELNKPIGHLQKASNHFKTAARNCAAKAKAIASGGDVLQRAEIEENARAHEQISTSMDRVLKMIQDEKMPTIEDIHSIEHSLLERHMAMEQRARIRAVAEELRAGRTA